MNNCNFAKVILARATKDSNIVKWWNGDDSTRPNLSKPKYDNTISNSIRWNVFKKIMVKYPKMSLQYDQFTHDIPAIQRYIQGVKYYKHNNKKGERKQFIQYFGIAKWESLPESEKKQHAIRNCAPCHERHKESSDLHVSRQENCPLSSLCANLTDAILDTSSIGTKDTEKKGEAIVKTVVQKIQPIVENKLKFRFTKVLSVTSRTQTDQLHDMKSKTKEIKKEMTGNDVSNFLASGKSYSLYDRDRMSTYFESKQVKWLVIMKTI